MKGENPQVKKRSEWILLRWKKSPATTPQHEERTIEMIMSERVGVPHLIRIAEKPSETITTP